MSSTSQPIAKKWEWTLGLAFVCLFGYRIIRNQNSFLTYYRDHLSSIEWTNSTLQKPREQTFGIELGLPTLSEIAGSDNAANISCPDGLMPILDTIIDPQKSPINQHRKIPQVVHITSKSRCATPSVIENVDKWRLQNHALYFHDDEAVDRLFQLEISQTLFPLLNETLRCVTNGATKSDLWRYLVLYLYGGIYTDADNTPTSFGANTIQDSDDSFYPVESLGVIAQFFMASSPGHPLLNETMHVAITLLRQIRNVMVNNPAGHTGPKALKNGFLHFLKDSPEGSDGYATAGIYVGLQNRTIRVVGNKTNPQEYVNRGGLGVRQKQKYYKQLGIDHFHGTDKKYPRRNSISCLEHIARTKGTHKVANYQFNQTTKKYEEVH